MVHISQRLIGHHKEMGYREDDSDAYDDYFHIEPGINYLTMESITSLPHGCDKVVLLPWGEPQGIKYSSHSEDEYDTTLINVVKEYGGMELVMKEYEEATN